MQIETDWSLALSLLLPRCRSPPLRNRLVFTKRIRSSLVCCRCGRSRSQHGSKNAPEKNWCFHRSRITIIELPRPDPPSVSAQVNNASSAYSHNYPTIKQSSLRVGEDVVCHRCSKCNAPFEEFNEEELGLCIVILSTFIHREPSLAASMLPEILRCNAKY